jgi:hypothetical protein
MKGTDATSRPFQEANAELHLLPKHRVIQKNAWSLRDFFLRLKSNF